MSHINLAKWNTLSNHNDGLCLIIINVLIANFASITYQFLISGLFSAAVHCNRFKSNRDYCSKPPENDAPPTKKKFSFSGKSFTSRMKKRSLDPTIRISTMMPLEPTETIPEPSETVSEPSETFPPKKDVR